jgi:peptidoglycan hydrolase CwlO-like protein
LLDQLLREIEEAESTALQPALDHLRGEQRDLQAGISRMEQQNAVLADLVSQYEDLLRRARSQLAGIMREREALRMAYEHALQDAGHP